MNKQDTTCLLNSMCYAYTYSLSLSLSLSLRMRDSQVIKRVRFSSFQVQTFIFPPSTRTHCLFGACVLRPSHRCPVSVGARIRWNHDCYTLMFELCDRSPDAKELHGVVLCVGHVAINSSTTASAGDPSPRSAYSVICDGRDEWALGRG